MSTPPHMLKKNENLLIYLFKFYDLHIYTTIAHVGQTSVLPSFLPQMPWHVHLFQRLVKLNSLLHPIPKEQIFHFHYHYAKCLLTTLKNLQQASRRMKSLK